MPDSDPWNQSKAQWPVQDGPDETAGDVDKNEDCDKDDGQLTSPPCFISEHLTLALASPLQIHTYIGLHTDRQTLDNAHSSQAQGLNLRRGRSLGGKVTVDISDVQTDGFLDEIWTSWNCWEIGWIAVTCSRQMLKACLPDSDDNVGNGSRLWLADRRDWVGW